MYSLRELNQHLRPPFSCQGKQAWMQSFGRCPSYNCLIISDKVIVYYGPYRVVRTLSILRVQTEMPVDRFLMSSMIHVVVTLVALVVTVCDATICDAPFAVDPFRPLLNLFSRGGACL